MFSNVEHIGIAVYDLAAANELYSKLLNISPYKTEAVESEGVLTSFFRVDDDTGHVGQTKIELLQATTPDSPVARFLAKKGEGVHHIAFEVTDIVAEMQRLAHEGFTLLNDTPKPGADNKLVCFLHPKTTTGVLIELCQEIRE
jgi:methylmalonyl-CoA/ethylmalonyl-CoA epimerase